MQDAAAVGAPRWMAPHWYFTCVALMLALHVALPLRQWNFGPGRWWGLVIVGIGVALLVKPLRRFRHSTTILPAVTPRELVTDGLFRWSRNPMYTGLTLTLAGAWWMLGSLTPGLALPLFVGVVDRQLIPHEERVLEATFGEAYLEYRKHVRRWI